MGRRLALLVATYDYQDTELRQLTAPAHDAEALAEVLHDPSIAGFEVTTLVNEPHHVVGAAIGDFYRDRRRDDLTLLYFTGHGLKDDNGRLYLAMTDTRRDSLLFTALSADQIDQAMEGCVSRQKVLILDCCYSGAFPSGRLAKADTAVHTLERFQGRGRTVLTASDATQYSFEGDHLHGQATQSVFTRHLVAGLRDGSADLDGDGDITLDELYSYVHDRVVEEMPQQRPKKLDNVEGRTVIARNINWALPAYLRSAIASPIASDRLGALDGLDHLYRIGNDAVRCAVLDEIRRLADDDSRLVSAAATDRLQPLQPAPREEKATAEAPRAPTAARETPTASSTAPGAEAPEPVPDAAKAPTETPGPVAGTPDAPPAPEAQPDSPAPGPSRRIPRRAILLGGLAAAVAAGIPTAVVLYGPDKGSDSSEPEGPDPVTSLLFTPDGKTLVTASYLEPLLLFWEVTTGRRSAVAGTGADSDGIYAMAFSPDGRTLATAHGDNAVRLMDVATRHITTTLIGHTEVITDGTGSSAATAVAFSPDGKTLASGGVDHTVRLWNIATGTNFVTITGHTARINSVAFSPDGKILASGSQDNTVGLWDAANGRPISTLTGAYAVFSPNGEILAIIPAHSQTVTLRDMASGRTATSAGNNSGPTVVAFSPDSKTLAVGGYDGSVALVDTATTRATATLKSGHTRQIADLAFSSDGKALATCSFDGTARLLNLATSRTTFTLTGLAPTS